MQTTVENLQSLANSIRQLFETLLLEHSQIYKWNVPQPGFVVYSARGDYAYRELSAEGRQIQSRLLKEYRTYSVLLKALLHGQPADSRRQLIELDTIITRTIEQEETEHQTTNEAFAKFSDALDVQIALLSHLYSYSDAAVILVPDTNALLFNTNLPTWRFADFDTFTMILVPSVLSELDSLKVNHRNEEVRRKALTLINSIKEYRRRGKISEGVPLKSGVSTMRTIAAEPLPEAFLPWFYKDNMDDRTLASTLELMRIHPNSRVVIVTSDINLQNKAEECAITYLEPPEI